MSSTGKTPNSPGVVRVTHQQHVGWLFWTLEHHIGGHQAVTAALLDERYQRMEIACRRAAQEFGEVRIEQAVGTLVWSRQEQDCRPVAYQNGEQELPIVSTWESVYLVEEVTVDPATWTELPSQWHPLAGGTD